MNDFNTDVNPNGGDDGNEQAWLSSVPENLRTNDAFKGIEKSSDAWQQFVDLKVNSEKSIMIPGEGATDEDRAAFLNKLGRPETAEKYTITKPENLSDGIYDENTEKVFKDVFHEIGLSDANANKLWSKYFEMAEQGKQATEKAAKDAHDSAVNALKDEWTGDKYKVNTEIAHRVFAGVFEDETQQAEAKKFIEETKIDGLSLGDHPMMLKVFAQIGAVIGDDKINLGRGDGVEGGLSEEEAARKRFPNTKFD